MVRTQVQLTREQMTALKRLAARKQVSMAEIIRQGVDLVLRSDGELSPSELKRRALSVVGRFHSGVPDLSTKHDQHFVEAQKK